MKKRKLNRQQLTQQLVPLVEEYNIIASRHRIATLTLEAVESYAADELKRAIAWLQIWRETVYVEYMDIRVLVSEDTWEAYKYIDSNGFREVKMLNAVVRKMKQNSPLRPQLFKGITSGKKETSEHQPARSDIL